MNVFWVLFIVFSTSNLSIFLSFCLSVLGEICSHLDCLSLCDIEKSSFKCFEIGLKTVLPSQVHTQRITKKIWDHLPDSLGTSKDCLNFQVCNRVTLD